MRVRMPHFRDAALMTATALLLATLFSPLVQMVRAQGASVGVVEALRGIPQFEENKDNIEYSLETNVPTSSFVNNNALNSFASGIIGLSVGGLPVRGPDGSVSYGRGAAGDMGKMISYMYQEPAATTERYVADVLRSARIVPPAYAQGIGFSALNPILETWRIFRNIAYFCFVVIFLVIGFMIMLRRKVGQAAITAQQAIPSIIVALLAVTFSYALAGLLIDVMYIVMYLILGVFAASPSDFLNVGPVDLGINLVKGNFTDSYQAVSRVVEELFGEGGIAGPVGTVIGAAGGLAAGVVISLAVVIGMFRLFFELLKTYVSIVIGVALAPLYLMLGALPGKSLLGKWIQNMIGNLAAFPTVLVILLLYDSLTGGLTGGNPSIVEGGFKPPYLFGVGGSQVIPFVIGLGMLLIMTELVVKAKKAMGATGGLFDQFAGDAMKSINRGIKGDQLIPGLGFTKVPGAQQLGKQFIKDPLLGSKESKERARDGKRTVYGRGIIPGGYRKYVEPTVDTLLTRTSRKLTGIDGDPNAEIPAEETPVAQREQQRASRKR